MIEFAWRALATLVFLVALGFVIGALVHHDSAGVAASGVCALLARESMREPR